ncbi:TPA: acyltransferase [Escherichia coli]|nr:acyltransferase [Escherichia coli]
MDRIGYIDIIKTIAIFLVLITHAHELAYIESISIKSILYSFDRIGVPLFLMVSGILIIDKAKDKGLRVFKDKRLYQFIAIFIIYCILTNAVYYHFAKGHDWVSSLMIAAKYNNLINYGRNEHAVHLWYMYLFITIYVLSPFIGKMTSSCSDKELLAFIIICLALNQASKSYDTLMQQGTLLNTLFKDFTGGCLVFFIFGYWYVRANKKETKHIINMTIATFIFIAVITCKSLYEIKSRKLIWDLNWYTSSITIALSGMAFFVILFELTKNSHPRKEITLISSLSFGVYLTHYIIVLAVSLKFRNYLLQIESYERIALLLFVSLLSFPLCYLMHKNKVTKWLIGC